MRCFACFVNNEAGVNNLFCCTLFSKGLNNRFVPWVICISVHIFKCSVQSINFFKSRQFCFVFLPVPKCTLVAFYWTGDLRTKRTNFNIVLWLIVKAGIALRWIPWKRCINSNITLTWSIRTGLKRHRTLEFDILQKLSKKSEGPLRKWSVIKITG